MATGLKIPVGVGRSGGAAIETDDVKQTKKILELALAEGGDDNAFQELGLDKTLVFSVNNPAFRGRAQRALDIILSKFTDRIRLAPDTPIKFEEGDEEGEVVMSFEYVDITTNKVEEFRKKFIR